MSLIGIVRSGDIIGAIKKLWSLIFGSDMPHALADLVAKFGTDEGTLVWNTAAAALAEIPTKGFQLAAADAWTAIATQAPSLALKDLEDALGIQQRATSSN